MTAKTKELEKRRRNSPNNKHVVHKHGANKMSSNETGKLSTKPLYMYNLPFLIMKWEKTGIFPNNCSIPKHREALKTICLVHKHSVNNMH